MALDAVRPLCLESPAEGGTQLCSWPTELDPSQDAITAAGLFVQNASNSATDKTTLISRTGAGLSFQDANVTRVLSELVSALPGQSTSHSALLDVVHFLEDGPGDGWSSGAVCQESYSGLLRTQAVWFTDATLAKRIVARVWTYTGLMVATDAVSVFARDGVTVVRTVTDTFSYNGVLRAQRTRTWGP